MQQFNLTEEDTSITRADIERILEEKPDDISKENWIRRKLNQVMDEEALNGVINDLDSY